MKPSDKEASKNRLQTFLSHSGVCSRRRALEYIIEGRVRMNDQVVREPSTPVDPQKDKVYLDGTLIKIKAHTYILLHKPKGVMTTMADKYAEKTVLDLLPEEYKHLYPVGRLDKDTEGLLLMTNDGDVAYKLTHPKFNIDKTYLVEIDKRLENHDKWRLEKHIKLEDGMTAPATIENVKFAGQNTIFRMTIHEGRKRQIRRMMEVLGYTVVNLKRIKQGPLVLKDEKLGTWRFLTPAEIASLKKL